MKAPGRLFIKIPSILYIILGAAALFVALFGMDIVRNFGDFGDTTLEFRIYWCVIGAFYLVVGIIGIKFCSSTHKTTALIVLAVFDMIIVVANMYVHFPVLDSHLGDTVSFGFDFSFITLLWFVLPILYLIGAIINKNYLNPTTQYYTYGEDFRSNYNSLPIATWTCEKCKVMNDMDANFCKGCGGHK
ncbi:MAG: hypothetical protein LBC86_07385 [Oscillospiraceae bacterium]|jgi:hypothetical protein|nr:hypothetical protein [Oscillospiraceae bacterium]